MIRPVLLSEVLATVTPEDFYVPLHGHIWAAFASLSQASQPIDAHTVLDSLTKSGVGQGKQTSDLLVTLIAEAGAASPASAAKYADIVLGCSRLRRLLTAAVDVVESCYNPATKADDAIDSAERAILEVSMIGRRHASAVPLSVAVKEWIDEMATYAEEGRAPGIMTGLPLLDKALAGFRPGQLITVAARPGIGKTIMGAHLGIHAARTGHPALLVSIEMARSDMVGRMIGADSDISLTTIRGGNLGVHDWPHIQASADRLAQIPLFILDESAASLAIIRAEARRIAAKTGLGLIVVDYLQLMSSPAASKRDNRQVEVAELSAGLKRIARELGVPVVALAQLNRSLEMREDKHPRLSDLRESGAIENDSDTVLGLYRAGPYMDPPVEDREMEIKILKQRSGPSGMTVTVGYEGSRSRLSHLETK